jgi:hypothetical protein
MTGDVTRSVREIQEVVYTVSPVAVRQAISAMLYDDHGGIFTPETSVTFTEDGSAIVVTPFVKDAA